MPRFVSHRVEAKGHRGYGSATQRSQRSTLPHCLGTFSPLRLPARSILLNHFLSSTLYPFFQTSPSRVVPSLNCFIWALSLTFTLVRRGNGLQFPPTETRNSLLTAIIGICQRLSIGYSST